MSKVSVIINGIKKARAELGDLVVKVTLRRKTGQTYANGKVTPVYTEKDLDGVHDKFDVTETDTSQVLLGDKKVVCFVDADQIYPDTDDLVVVDGEEYTVKKSSPTYAGNVIVVTTLQLRK